MSLLKIIFLDIDGVLNPVRFMNILHKMRKELGKGVKTEDNYGQYFAPWCVDALNKIIKETDAKIVITSTWRRFLKLPDLIQMWKDRGLPGEIYDVTDILNLMRGEEIQQWLLENTVDSYVIIDDDDDMLPEQNFIKTNSNIGLTDDLADDCIKILNNDI